MQRRHLVIIGLFAVLSPCGSSGMKPPPKEWWAVRPIDRAVLATMPGSVDGFIEAALRKQGLSGSPEADKHTLIRRASFALTGLPPTPEEVREFVADTSPDAYPRLVERLLASPHYGEQWARHWLDVARYSDTKGYVYAREEKRFVHAAPYRDWVARSLNQDMGYDRFLLLQIAADQVEKEGSPHLAAMGFLTLGRRFLGVTPDIIDDRIDVLTRGTMGLTVGCARCHDHKFDPIPTKDYYSLYGVFQSSADKLASCGPVTGDAAFLKELRLREQKVKDTMALRCEEQAARTRAKVTEHLVAQLELEKYPEETFNQVISGEELNPIVVRRWQAYLQKCATHADPVFAAWHAYAKIPAKDFAKSAPEVSTKGGHPWVARAFATPPSSMREVAERYGALFKDVEKQWQALRRATPEAKALPDPDAEALRAVMHAADSPCVVQSEHIANNENLFPTNVINELWKAQNELDAWLVDHPESASYAGILVDRAIPTNPRVFLRGNPVTKGEEVPRHFLTVLSNGQPRTFGKGSGRLELAQAIIDPANPLTARVMANRVWTQHFGQGLVATPSDFGTRADPPSHPELLDWLALRFMESGWSIKALHRMIMLSRTYRQSSLGPADALALRMNQEKDPQNHLLWRMNAHRLSFEETRDGWLAAAGRLDPRVGGKPQDLFAGQNTRRTLYAMIDREHLPTVLRTFDFANPDLSTPKRTDTTVSQQALFGLNHPFLAAQAAALRQRPEVRNCGNDAERIRCIYELLYQRPPTAGQQEAALSYIQGAEGAPQLAVRDTAKAWQYGYGEWDEKAGAVKGFTPLPLFNGSAWQGGDHWPDVKLGWAQLTAAGGHPGNDRKHAVVRRWTAPADGSYSIASIITHEPKVGDGIRAFIGHNRQGQLRAATVHGSEAVMSVDELAMKAGDTLDFVVDIGGGLNSDQFLWAPQIHLSGMAGSGGDIPEKKWDASGDFTVSNVSKLDPWEQLVQVLMLANEFVFVD